ncbi:unnamed protein product [Oreochromis niloticus]|nr:unnamed protein product [Mustela putorius furo]
MAANIEQIFQDFILNKIREIEDQNEDKADAKRVGDCSKMDGAENASTKRYKDLRSSSSHKKHKKHKSKRKKRNREKESSSESGADLKRKNKHKSRRGTPTERKAEQGGDHESKSRCRKKHLIGKRKKKKRRKDDENSSDTDSAFVLKHTKLKRQEELPDIIPKQENSNKGIEDEERRDRQGCHSSSHSYSQSHSCSVKNSDSRTRHYRQRSRTCSPSNTRGHRTRSSSSEKKDVEDESFHSQQWPPNWPKPPQGNLSNTEGNIEAEELTESRVIKRQTSNHSEKPEDIQREETEKLASSASKSMPSHSISAKHYLTTEPGFLQCKASEKSFPANVKSAGKKRKKSPQKKKEEKSSKKQKKSKSPRRGYKRESRSTSPSLRKRSRSRSRGRRPRRSHSRSVSQSRRRVAYSQRDRWKREPSHSPVLILRKNRSPSRKHGSLSNSPHRISELDKEQLLEIAKANAAAMCAKAGMPIPASLRSSVLPLALPTMAMNAAMASMTAATVTAALTNIGTLSSLVPLPSIMQKPPVAPAQPNIANLEEVKRKVAKQANSISIKEFTDKCKMIADSTEELPVAVPHVSDEEDDEKPFGGSALREPKAISFSVNNSTVRPAVRSDAGMAKEFPVSSGTQHRKKEGEGLGAYGEWVPVDKTTEKAAVATKAQTNVLSAPPTSSSSGETATVVQEVIEQPAFVTNSDKVFPDPQLQQVDITQAVTERIKAQRRLAENPYDISAIRMLTRAQEQVDAWAQSNTVPGLFTGSTGAQILSSEELSTSGPQAWLKKDQFLRAAPVSGGVGEFLMRKMGWKTGEGLGRNREGTVEPIVIDFKVDRKGLVAEGEKLQKQTGGLVVTKDLMGKHPVSALIELCNKRKIMQPDFVMVHHSGPDHRKNFLFKVTVNGVDYQPQTASPNKKHAKAMAATVALQALGEVPVDGPGLYTGPVFTAASTGPLFST